MSLVVKSKCRLDNTLSQTHTHMLLSLVHEQNVRPLDTHIRKEIQLLKKEKKLKQFLKVEAKLYRSTCCYVRQMLLGVVLGRIDYFSFVISISIVRSLS